MSEEEIREFGEVLREAGYVIISDQRERWDHLLVRRQDGRDIGGSHRAAGHREATDDSAMVGATDPSSPTVVRAPFSSANVPTTSPPPESLAMKSENVNIGLSLPFEMRAYADNLVRGGVNGVPNAIYQWADRLDRLADPALGEALEKLRTYLRTGSAFIPRGDVRLIVDTLIALRGGE